MKNNKYVALVLAAALMISLVGCTTPEVDPVETTAAVNVPTETEMPTEPTQTEPAETEPPTEATEETEPPIVDLIIDTAFCQLTYPGERARWVDYEIVDEAVGYTVKFYSTVKDSRTHLFDICFGGMMEGTGFGMIEDQDGVCWDVVVAIYALEMDDSWTQEEKDLVYSMQEDMNIILDTLATTGKYIPNS